MVLIGHFKIIYVFLENMITFGKSYLNVLLSLSLSFSPFPDLHFA